jgi:peptide-methionine (S)-S-oxide reductase
MEKGIKYWHAMSDPALLELLGKFIQQTRLQQNKTQQQVAKAMINTFEEGQVYSAPIVTEVTTASIFYPAEDYHQYYFAKNPSNPYCLAVAAPKAAKIRAKYAQLLKD